MAVGAITATAAMQLVEQGKLDLDSPISTWIPLAAELQVLDGFDDSSEPILREPARAVTLRHLMTHRSGHAYVQWHEDLKRYGEAVGELPLLDYDDPESWPCALLGRRFTVGVSPLPDRQGSDRKSVIQAELRSA